MIKRLLAPLFILALATTFSSCEKDDICALTTETTPRLLMEFFNSAIPSDNKNVTDLQIAATGETSAITYNNASKILVPLKTTEDTVEFNLTIFASSEDPAVRNVDRLVFNYARNEVYISRACGYKIDFLLNQGNGIVLSDPDGSQWIKSIRVVQPTIITENTTHVKVFF